MNSNYDEKIRQLQYRLAELNREVAITLLKIVEYERLRDIQPAYKQRSPLEVLEAPVKSGLAYLEQMVRRLVETVIKVRK